MIIINLCFFDKIDDAKQPTGLLKWQWPNQIGEYIIPGSGHRLHRIPQNAPASIERWQDTYNSMIADTSESSSIKFVLPQGNSRVRFDLGNEIYAVSAFVKVRGGCVARHYDGSFALNFHDFGSLDPDVTSPVNHDN